jgi:hypothetical protein
MNTYDHGQARQAVQLSADIYLPRAELQAKYPDAAIIEAGCDRCMVLKLLTRIYVAFMGTHDLPSLISDFDVKRKPFLPESSGIAGLEVHSGFINGVDELWPGIVRAIDARANGYSTLILTGHSRGASQAELFAARYFDLPSKLIPPIEAVLPIAPARPGNAAFRDWYNRRLGSVTYFFHHGADIVPWEGPWFMGNRGVGHRVWFPDVLPVAFKDTLLDVRPAVIDPSLEELAGACALLTWRAWVNCPPQIEQLKDHHVDTYIRLLT